MTNGKNWLHGGFNRTIPNWPQLALGRQHVWHRSSKLNATFIPGILAQEASFRKNNLSNPSGVEESFFVSK